MESTIIENNTGNMDNTDDMKTIIEPNIEQGTDFIPTKNIVESDSDSDSDDGYESYDSFYDNGIKIEFNTNHLVLLYHGRDEDTQSNKYKLIEFSPSDSLCLSDITIKIPDSDKENKDKIIRDTLKANKFNKNYRYLYTHKHYDRYGVWNTRKNAFYLILRQNCFKHTLLYFVLNHSVISYNTPYQLKSYNTIKSVI